jgi:hypothetical protein
MSGKGKRQQRRKPLPQRPVYVPDFAKALEIVSVNRIEALCRVLDTAIWLCVWEKDPVAIHLLVMSQYQCLEDLCTDRGIKPFATEHTTWEQRNLAYNWLKHASKNSRAGVDFSEISNRGYLYDAIFTFRQLFNTGTAYMKAFVALFEMRFVLDNPEFRDCVEQDLPKGFRLADVETTSRVVLFNKLVEAFGRDAGCE